jgi:hypothetical protein
MENMKNMFYKISAFVSLLFTIITIVYLIERSKTKPLKIRRIEGLEAIEEAVGRAVEMGRPVM